MLTFLNENSGAIQAITTTILVLVTIYYAIQTRKTVEEMKEARRYEFLPILEIVVVAESYHTIRITLSNIGKGMARSPKIYMPMSDLIQLKNLGPRGVLETTTTVQPDSILQLAEDDRKMRVEYLDVFSRVISSEALLVAESVERHSPRNNHLTIKTWNLILP